MLHQGMRYSVLLTVVYYGTNMTSVTSKQTFNFDGYHHVLIRIAVFLEITFSFLAYLKKHFWQHF